MVTTQVTQNEHEYYTIHSNVLKLFIKMLMISICHDYVYDSGKVLQSIAFKIFDFLANEKYLAPNKYFLIKITYTSGILFNYTNQNIFTADGKEFKYALVATFPW